MAQEHNPSSVTRNVINCTSVMLVCGAIALLGYDRSPVTVLAAAMFLLPYIAIGVLGGLAWNRVQSWLDGFRG
jgi:hypothetical protein